MDTIKIMTKEVRVLYNEVKRHTNLYYDIYKSYKKNYGDNNEETIKMKYKYHGVLDILYMFYKMYPNDTD